MEHRIFSVLSLFCQLALVDCLILYSKHLVLSSSLVPARTAVTFIHHMVGTLLQSHALMNST
uniref:Uncharacterized protein n=1 Tax=Arundo donax TaxID=35708 RepID=A0A0A9G3I0_ARUDO